MTGTYLQNRRFGYARVSTYGQTLDAQLGQLRAAGCSKIYREKATGAHNDRRELLKMIHALAPGAVIIVTRIDRLARSTLYGLDTSWQAQPQMVEGHEVEEDGLTWLLRLRDGLRFHDNEPVFGEGCRGKHPPLCSRRSVRQRPDGGDRRSVASRRSHR